MNKKVIAVFGGSFNPPINSHITLAKEIMNKFNSIEKLVFVPVSTRYQKEDLVEDEHRYNMLKLICNKEEMLEVSDIELKQEKQMYTIQTLDIFKEKYKNYDIYFVMGTDNLKELQTWKKADRLLNEYKIIVIERDNDNLSDILQKNSFLNKYKDSLINIEGVDRIFLSSTMIREKIKDGEDVEQFIDEDVLMYIEKNNLYKI